MPTKMTIRGIPDDVLRRVEGMAKEAGTSVSAKAIQLLEQAVALASTDRRARLSRYTTWTVEDLLEFESSLAAQRMLAFDPQ